MKYLFSISAVLLGISCTLHKPKVHQHDERISDCEFHIDTLLDYSKFYNFLNDKNRPLDSSNYLKIMWGADFNSAKLLLENSVDCYDSYIKKIVSQGSYNVYKHENVSADCITYPEFIISISQDTLILVENRQLGFSENPSIQDYNREIRFYLNNGKIHSSEVYGIYPDNRRFFMAQQSYSYSFTNRILQIEIDRKTSLNTNQGIVRYIPKEITLKNIDLMILLIEHETTSYFSWMSSAILTIEINGLLDSGDG